MKKMTGIDCNLLESSVRVMWYTVIALKVWVHTVNQKLTVLEVSEY